MKKQLLILAGICMCFMVKAQIPNGNFENWTTLSIETPNGWNTSNSDLLSLNLPPNVSKTTNAHKGNYAIRVKTVSAGTKVVFGYFINSIGDPVKGEGGIPYSQKPDSFSCWMKPAVQPGDTGLILIIFKKNSAIISMNQYKYTGNDTTTWQYVAFKLDSLVDTPDSVIIGASPSNAVSGLGVTPGSYVIIDELKFNTSQPIPNGGFENWTLNNLESPDGWYSDNNYVFLASGRKPVQKTNDAHSGTSALKLTTTWAGINGEFSSAIYSGEFRPPIVKGFPYKLKQDTLEFWYKYQPRPGDTAGVNIVFIKGNNFFDFAGSQITAASSYTKFVLPFSLMIAPDSAIIQFTSSTGSKTDFSDTGSVLILDEVHFASSPLTSIQEVQNGTSISVYPNPASNGIYITSQTVPSKGTVYSIIDNMGRTVLRNNLVNHIQYVNMEGFNRGIYTIMILDNHGSTSRTVILK